MIVKPMEKPRLEWLAVDGIETDARYQRATEGKRSQLLIARIAERFEWALFGVVTVAEGRTGRRNVIDGQHRLEAARRRGIAEVPALVVATDDVAEAARLFLGANRDRVRVTPNALYYAELAANEEEALAVERACRAAGIEIARYPIPTNLIKPGVTLAVGTIRQLLRKHGEALATEALRLVAARHAGTPGALTEWRFKGVAHALGALGLTDEEIAAVLDKADDEACEREVYCSADAEGWPRWLALAKWLDAAASQTPAPAGKPKPRATAVPSRRAEPADGSTRRPASGGATLAFAVRRRCGCGAVFLTNLPGQYRCGDCEGATR